MGIMTNAPPSYKSKGHEIVPLSSSATTKVKRSTRIWHLTYCFSSFHMIKRFHPPCKFESWGHFFAPNTSHNLYNILEVASHLKVCGGTFGVPLTRRLVSAQISSKACIVRLATCTASLDPCCPHSIETAVL